VLRRQRPRGERTIPVTKEEQMLYLVHWKIEPEHRDANFGHWKEKGSEVPSGITLSGPWYSLSQQDGWAVAETDDPTDVAKWLHAWSDLNEMEITPVVDDEAMGDIIQ
jgi:hypothetical protein